jgi:hypothetical protein
VRIAEGVVMGNTSIGAVLVEEQVRAHQGIGERFAKGARPSIVLAVLLAVVGA